MEEIGSSFGHLKTNNRYKNSINIQTTSHKQLETLQICNKSIPRDVRTDQSLTMPKNFITTKESRSKLCFKDVPAPQEQRRSEAHFRLAWSQQPRESKEIPTNLSLQNSRLFTGRRLDDSDRPIPSIFPCTNCCIPQTSPSYRIRQEAVSDDELALWPLICPSNLRDYHELDCGNPSCARYEGSRIFGRLSTGLSKQNQLSPSDSGGSRTFGALGLASQPSKMCINPMPEAGVSGNCLEHPEQSDQPTKEKSPQDCGLNQGSQDQGELYPETDPVPSRPVEFCQFRHRQRASSLPPPSTVFYDLSTGEAAGEAVSSTHSNKRAGMVERSHSYRCLSSLERNYPLFDYRRSGRRVGSTVEWNPHLRNLDKTAEHVALQPKGDVCGVRLDKRSGTEPAKDSHSFTNRQPNSGSLYPEGRGYKILRSTQSHLPVVETSRRPANNSICGLSPREIQWYSRPAVTKKGASGVAPSTRGNKPDFQKMGHPRHRSLRISEFSRGQTLRLQRLHRSIRLLHRRIQSSMGLQTGMGVPSTQPHPQSLGTLEQEQRTGTDRNPQLGEDVLDVRPNPEIYGATNADSNVGEGAKRHHDRSTTPRDRAPFSPGVEGWVWGELVNDWSTQEKELVKGSWRRSTLETYKTPIRRWINWCEQNNINPGAPRGQDLARFLANLFITQDLAYSTILVHKSAVATFCSGNSSGTLSSDFLVHRVLKAISIAKPRERRTEIWDAQVLLDWLSTPADKLSFFEISRRAAAVLLIASGRRIHDLTLLKISKNFITNLGNEIILWPDFGSKTDRGSFRQSGWKLSRHPNIWLCPVTWLRALLKKSEDRRATEGLDQVFITVTGPVKPASTSVIGGWIRSVLKAAGIDASPGSIRSAVASRGWLDNIPIQDILDRGNWKCVETFRKHYCRQVKGSDQGNSSLLFTNFTPI
ncbi:uncharacterized protein LOC124301607 [Neodiprion virginianus]|uniref:uncharacterized protein LOC124301607 n=1 Tax=Neodiprion virginianus TaxID=2961670 RepID=UPI001EE69D3C|nr:uncharacterized protein LOC124301607 [Neodiprion virginianus]